MSMLSRATSGRIRVPDRITMHGLDGVGKSTFGSQAPKPFFLGPEKGSANLDVTRLEVQSIEEVFDALKELGTSKHDFQSLVIDSWDWIEPMIHSKVCRDEGCGNIEQVGGGFGKGYVVTLKYLRTLLEALDWLQRKTGMGIIGICHSEDKAFNNPITNTSYSRYTIKMNAKAAALIREWSEVVLFASKKVISTKIKGTTRYQAISDGTSYMYSRWTPAYDAKSRYAIDEEMPLHYESYRRSMDSTDEEKAKVLLEEIQGLLAQCQDEALKKQCEDFLAKVNQKDVLTLTKTADRLRERIFQTEKTNA